MAESGSELWSVHFHTAGSLVHVTEKHCGTDTVQRAVETQKSLLILPGRMTTVFTEEILQVL